MPLVKAEVKLLVRNRASLVTVVIELDTTELSANSKVQPVTIATSWVIWHMHAKRRPCNLGLPEHKASLRNCIGLLNPRMMTRNWNLCSNWGHQARDL